MSIYSDTAKRVVAPGYAMRNAIYDTQVVDNTTATVEFFPPRAEAGGAISNYEENPFPGVFRRLIHQLGFELSAKALVFASATAASTFLNNLNNAYVEIWTGDQRCNYQRFLLSDLVNFRTHTEVVDNDGDEVIVHFDAMQIPSTIEPILVERNERFYLQVIFPSNGGLPAAANGTPAGKLHLRAKLGVSRWSEEQEKSSGSINGDVIPVRPAITRSSGETITQIPTHFANGQPIPQAVREAAARHHGVQL